MKKLFFICLSIMLTTSAYAQNGSKKATNILVGITPELGTTKGTITWRDGVKEKCSFNKDLGVTIGLERVINGYIILPELHYLRGSYKSAESDDEILLSIRNYDKLNQYGFIQWFGFSINSQRRVQVPLMAGIGVDYVDGTPFDHVVLFDYGAKARVKVYITPKFGLFVGGAIQAASGSYDNDKMRIRNITSELGFTVTL